MWGEFRSEAEFALAIIGITGLGAGLDAAVPHRIKRQVRLWSRVQSVRLRKAQFGGHSFFDSLFGQKIVSKRSIAVTATITTISLAVSYLVAFVTSDYKTRELLVPLSKGYNINDVTVLATFIVMVFLSDFLSYAQTRIFIGAIDQVRSYLLAILLYTSDLILSVGIFCVAFAMAKAAVTVFTAAFLYNPHFTRTTDLSPEVVVSSYSNFDPTYRIRPVSALRDAIARYDEAPTPASELDLQRRTSAVAYVATEKGVTRVSFGRVRCIEDFSLTSEQKTHVYEVMRDSNELAQSLLGLGGMAVTFGGSAPFSAAANMFSHPKGCPLHVISVSANISSAAQLSGITVTDYFLGSLQITIQMVSSSILTKFEQYQTDDPISGSFDVLNRAYIASKTRFLGIGGATDVRPLNAYLGNLPTGHLRVPFSIFAGSSLTANVLFGIYFISSIAVSVARGIFSLGSLRSILPKDWIFFRLSCGAAVLVVALSVGSLLLGLAFGGILRLLMATPVAS